MIRKAPVVLKGDMTLRDARQYADAVQYAGGRVQIREHGFGEEDGYSFRPVKIKSLESFIMCPECGFKQIDEGRCARCGHIFGDRGIGLHPR